MDIMDNLESLLNEPASPLDRVIQRRAQKEQEVIDASMRQVEALDRIHRANERTRQLDAQVASLGTDNDNVRQAVGGAMSGTGSVISAPGWIAEQAGRLIESGLVAAGLEDQVRAVNQKFQEWGIGAPSEAFQGVGGWLKEGGREIQSAINASTQYELDQSTPTGDVLDPSTWSLGDNPSLAGYVSQMSRILGEFAPQAAGLVAKSPETAMKIMGAIGGLQAGEGQASQAVDTIMQMDEATLMESSDLYRTLREENPSLTHEQAQQETARTAGAASFMGGALVGTAGGAATGYILRPLQGKLQGNALARGVKSGTVSAAEEAAQEVGETVTGRAAANVAAGMDQDLTEGTFGDAVLGGSFGGGLGVAGTTAEEIGKLTEKALSGTTTNLGTKEKDIVAAADSGDVSKFLDPEDRKNYDPLAAMGALVVRSRREEIPEAEKTQLRASMQNVMTILQEDGAKLQRQVDNLKPEAIENTRQTLASKKQELAAAETEQEQAQIRDDIEFLQMVLDDAENVDPKRVAAMEKQLQSINTQITEAQAIFDQVPGTRTTTEEVESLKASAGITPTETPVSESDRMAAAKQLTVVAMQNPDLLSEADTEALINDGGNGLSDNDRQFLRTLTKAQVAANLAQTMAGTRRGVVQGTDGFIGIRQYQSRMANAVQAKNTKVAEAQLSGIRKFRESHEAKSKAVQQAFDQAQKTGKPVIVARGKGHTDWKVTQRQSLSDTFRNHGALRIRPGSSQLVETIGQEVEALKASEAMLQSAYAIGFASPETATEQPEAASTTTESPEVSSTSTEEVTNAQEPENETVTEPEATVAEEAAGVGEEAPQSTDGSPERTEAGADSGQTLRERTEQGNTAEDAGVEPELEPVNPEAEAPVEEEVRYEEGTLSVFKEKAQAITGELTDAAFRGLNLVRQYFKQTSKKDSDVTERPLVVQANFLSALRTDESVADLFVDARRYGKSDGSGLSEAQYAAIRDFAAKAEAWNEYLETSLIDYDAKEQYGYRDLFHQLRDGKPTEENIKTAISYAAYSWLIDNASRPAQATDEEINQILHRRPEHAVTDTERAELGLLGTRDKLVINTLGQKAVEALGIRAGKDTPVNLVSQLEASLGAYAMQLLVDQKLAVRDLVQNDLLSRQPDDADDVAGSGKFEKHPFVRLARDENLKPIAEVEAIGAANRNTQSILSHLMGVESGFIEPEFVEPEFNQAFTKGTNQRVPKRQQKIEAKKGKYAYQLREAMLTVWDSLDTDTKYRVVGVKDTENKAVHRVNRKSFEGYNEGLIREIELFDEFAGIEENRSRPFWLRGNVWKQQRVGLKSNTINPQTSKIHRHLVSMTGWKVSVDVRLDSSSNRMFRLNVATGLGVKTDKQTVETSLTALDELLANKPVFLDAVEAIKKSLNGEALSETDRDTIAEAVEAGGEAMQTMDSLLGLAQWELAADNGLDSFETDMMLEIDGVTNGPMLAQLQLGAAPSAGELNAILNKGGMYELGSEFTNFNNWKENAKQPDLYETLAKDIADAMQQVIQGADAWKATNYVAMNHFMKGLFDADNHKVTIGRNAVKTPLTAMVFGSSVKNAIKSMSDEFVQGIYDRIEADANLPEAERAQATKTTIQRINALLKPGFKEGVKPLSENMTTEQLLEFEFDKKQLETVGKMFNWNIGKHVEGVMENRFGLFLARRTELNRGAQLAFHLYDTAYQYYREKVTTELVKEGVIPVSTTRKGKKIARYDLTPEQERLVEQRVRAAMPMVHTPLSKDSKDLGAGLFAAKTERTLAKDDDSAYTQSVRFKDGRTLDGRGMKRQMVDPGVATLIMMIHSSDSAISSYAAEQLEALNIHDAHGLSLTDAQQGGQNLNKATYEVMRDYSAPLEIRDALVRTLKGILALGEDLNDPELQKRFADKAAWIAKEKLSQFEERDDVDPRQGYALNIILRGTSRVARDAELLKLENMAKAGAYNQYAFEGGEYTVTDADRAKAEAKLADVQAQPADLGMDVLNTFLDRVLGAKPVPQKDVEPKVSNPESLASKVEVAAALEQWAAEESQRLHATRIGDAKAVRRLNDLTAKYAASGDLSGSIEAVYPETQRETIQQELVARLRSSVPPVTSIRSASKSAAAEVLESVITYAADALPEGVRADLQTVQDAMNASAVDLVDAAFQNFPGDRAEVLLATLDRYYNSARMTAFGKIGTPLQTNHSGLVSFFESKPVHTAKETLAELKRILKARKAAGETQPEDAFHNQMINLLSGILPADVSVSLLTPEEPKAPGEIVGSTIKKATAFYVPSSRTVRVKSTDFATAKIVPETVLHELTHAALYDLIEQAKRGEASAEVQALVTELDELRQKVRAEIQGMDKADRRNFEYGVSNLQEFVAFGLSDYHFQTEVLQKVMVPHQNKGNRLVTAMQAFVDKVVRILFKRPTSAQTTGMEVMLANVSGLAKAVQEQAGKEIRSQNGNPDVLAQMGPDPLSEAKKLTNEEVFDRLASGNLSTDRANQLKGLLGSIVDKLHGPMGALGAQLRQDAAYGPEDRYLEHLVNGTLPFYSKALGAELKLSQAEGFVLEQVEMVVRESLNSDRAAYQELAKLYKEARAQIKESDLPAGAHKFIFTPQRQDGENTSDYLSRFAALAMVYQPLAEKMEFTTAKTDPTFKGKKLGEAIKAFFARILEILNGRMTNTFAGQQADAKAMSLVNQLVDNEAQYRASAARREQTLENAEKGAFQILADAAREKVTQFAESNPIANNSNVAVRSFGIITSAIANDRVRELFDGLDDVRNKIYAGQRQGIWAAVATEFKGANGTNLTAHELLRIAKHNEQTRKVVKEQMAKGVLESFDPKHALTDNEKTALTKVLLRTDMSAILGDGDSGVGTYDLATLTRLVSDPQALAAEIKTLERSLAKQKLNVRYYLAQAKNTGYFLAEGRNTSANLMFNAHNIVNLVGADGMGQKPTAAQAKALEPLVDRLVSLYALKYADSTQKGLAANVMKRELARGRESGVEMMLKTHDRLKREAMEKLFDGEPALFRKGYTKEIYNPYKEVVLAPVSQRDDLVRQGYKAGAILEQDPVDPDLATQKQLFVMPDAGMKSRVTGIMSNTGMVARGTTIHHGLSNISGDGVVAARQDQNNMVAGKLAADVSQLFYTPENYDPTRVKGARLAPVVNNAGQIVNYRYMMSEHTKDTLMERNNAMEEILGAMAANIVDKVSSREHNNRAVEAMHQQFREESSLKPHAFIKVSAESEDPAIREAWNLIPEGTKRHIRKVWGRNEMWVRADLYDLHFGYRKFSLADPWKTPEDERSLQQKLVIATFEAFLGAKAAMRIARAENVWEEVVREVKDIWVIKNVVTLLGNITSNLTELFWFGVNPVNMVRDHREALQGILSYQRDFNEKLRLENILESGYLTQPAEEIEARLVELEDSINRNPVKELVDAGIFQTIVEDVDSETSDYSYKSKLVRKIQGLTDRLPESVNKAGKTLYMAHDTPLYKLMYQGTSLSDFTARYVLFKHLTTRDTEPMAKEEAIQTVVDAFVNYDIPTHRGLQYINDIGIIPFTKYYIRIQKVLMTLYRENPARALAVATFGWFFDSIGVLTDSGIWNKADNPLGSGAFEYFNAVDDIAPIRAAMSIAG